jgi:hypothetical protein
MAEDTKKTTSSRSWSLAQLENGSTPWLWVSHATTTKDVGLPTEVTEHNWKLEARFPKVGRDTERSTVLLAEATDQASFDNLLNDVRLAMVDARAWVQAGGLP